jgi:SsrA-binding protein
MKKKPASPPSIVNRRARFDYELSDDLVVGIVLTGQEVRAARDGHVQLRGSYVTIRDGELWLNNSSFSLKLNQKGGGTRTVDTSVRKLLASRRQIDDLAARKKSGMSIIPTKLLTTGNYIKLVIALGRGKKLYDKRQTLKKRAEERDTRRTV